MGGGMGIRTRLDEIRFSKHYRDSPELKERMRAAGITYASPTFLRGETPIERCIIDDAPLVDLTPDGMHRKCHVCQRAYYFASGQAR